MNLWKGLALEGVANRDSLPYAEKYGLGPIEELKDLYRGTLRYFRISRHILTARYQGFSSLLDAFRMLGLLNTAKLPETPRTWDEVISSSIAAATGEKVQSKDVLPFLKQSGLPTETLEQVEEALHL